MNDIEINIDNDTKSTNKESKITTTDFFLEKSSLFDIRILDYDIEKKEIKKAIIIMKSHSQNKNIWYCMSNKIKLTKLINHYRIIKIDKEKLTLNLIAEKYLNPTRLYEHKNHIIFCEIVKNYSFKKINLTNGLLENIYIEDYITENIIRNSNYLKLNELDEEMFYNLIKNSKDLIKKYFHTNILEKILKLVKTIKCFNPNYMEEDNETIIIEDLCCIEKNLNNNSQNQHLNFTNNILNTFIFNFVNKDEILFVSNINSIHLLKNFNSDLKYLVLYSEYKILPNEKHLKTLIENIENKINHKLKAIIYLFRHTYLNISESNNYINDVVANYYNLNINNINDILKFKKNLEKVFTKKYNSFFYNQEMSLIFMLSLHLINLENDNEYKN